MSRRSTYSTPSCERSSSRYCTARARPTGPGILDATNTAARATPDALRLLATCGCVPYSQAQSMLRHPRRSASATAASHAEGGEQPREPVPSVRGGVVKARTACTKLTTSSTRSRCAAGRQPTRVPPAARAPRAPACARRTGRQRLGAVALLRSKEAVQMAGGGRASRRLSAAPRHRMWSPSTACHRAR